LNGKITVGDANATHDAFYTLVLSAGDQETGVSVTALEGDTDLILVRIVCMIKGVPWLMWGAC
jgi:hypothetical protein